MDEVGLSADTIQVLSILDVPHLLDPFNMWLTKFRAFAEW